MSRMVGTVSMGIRAPIIRSGDDLVEIVTNSVLETVKDGALTIRDRDVIAMTEAIVARAQGNYASVDDIAADVRAKLGGETVGVLFPILSRNRFAICLRASPRGQKGRPDAVLPSDEVGNHLIDVDAMDEKGWTPIRMSSPWSVTGSCSATPSTFTGVDYVDYYSNLIRESGAEVEVIFANDPRAILPYTKNVLACDIHTRARTKRRLLAAGAEKVFCLDEIMTASIDGSGYNGKYGLLGSNKSTEDKVKLFPRECQDLVEAIQARILKESGKHVEVMVYGDGAFKDPWARSGSWLIRWSLPPTPPAWRAPQRAQAQVSGGQRLCRPVRRGAAGCHQRRDQRRTAPWWAKWPPRAPRPPPDRPDRLPVRPDLRLWRQGYPIVYIQGYFDNYTTE